MSGRVPNEASNKSDASLPLNNTIKEDGNIIRYANSSYRNY